MKAMNKSILAIALFALLPISAASQESKSADSKVTPQKEVKTVKIVIGTDGFGLPLMKEIKKHLAAKKLEVIELPESNEEGGIPYYKTADTAAKMIIAGKADRAILFCGTGMGMAIIANKHKGIYAAVCETVGSAEKSRSVNNSNVLTLGALMTTSMTAKDMVDVWLKTEFTEGWDPAIQNWLKGAVKDIDRFETGTFK